MPRSHIWIVLFSIALFYIVAARSMALKSMTSDEGPHLVSGYSAWKHRSHRINPEHPPFVKMIAAIPLVLNYSFKLEDYASWREGRQWDLWHELLWQKGVDADRMHFWGRFMLLIFLPLTALVVYRFALPLWHEAGALTAFLLTMLCPNFIAHAGIIHNDVPLAFSFILFSYCAWRYAQNQTWKNLWAFAASTGLALIIKFSGLLLFPAALFFFFMAHRRRIRPLRKDVLLQLLVLLVVPLMMMSWSYGYFLNLRPYFEGLAMLNHNRSSDYDYFMNGKFSRSGFLAYYPFAMALKIPLPTLILFLLGLVPFCTFHRRVAPYLLLPGLLLCVALTATGVNIGVRHAFPLFPALFVIGGGVASIRKQIFSKGLLLLLLAWLGIETVRTYPDYLAYFNQFAGGAAGGLRYLDDSNIDWGQDLKRLPEALERHHIREFKLKYAGQEKAEYRGLNASRLELLDRYFPDGDFVVSAHILRRNTLSEKYQGLGFDWLEHYRPVEVVGHTLYIYRFRITDRTEFKEGINFFAKSPWLEHGFKRISETIDANPQCFECYWLMARAHRRYGDLKEVPANLQKAIQLNPRFLDGYVELMDFYKEQHEPHKVQAVLNVARQNLAREPALLERLTPR